MANTFAPFGFSQFKGTGSAPTYEQVASLCNYNTAAMYFGDPVFRDASGFVQPDTPGTDTLSGVFVGCKYLSVAQKRTVWSNYWPGSDVASGQTPEVYLVNDPNAQFLVQVGGSVSTGLTQAAVGLNVQFAYGTPNAMSGLSGAYVVYNSGATTSTLPFRVVSIYTGGPPGSNGSTVPGAYNYVIVAFNNVETKSPGLTGAAGPTGPTGPTGP